MPKLKNIRITFGITKQEVKNWGNIESDKAKSFNQEKTTKKKQLNQYYKK